jgi:hypothetical protein
MRQVRTARGRLIDMGALAKANEQQRAVSPGNIKMNARGDRLDPSGNVIQTVQAKARLQHKTSSAPEKRKLSEVPGAPPKVKVKKKSSKRATSDPIIVREEEKTREDGSRYIEIEYEDGSMNVKELDT